MIRGFKNYLFVFIFIFTAISCVNNKGKDIIKLEGDALGTTFHITYKDAEHRNFSKQIDSLLHDINKSLSTYMLASDISKINRGDTSIVVDKYFAEVFKKSKKIYKESNGYFDPTVGILVNAWGFGPEKTIKQLNQNKIYSLLQYVGFAKVKLINNRIKKANKNIFLDFNADAKGYAIDVLGRFLESKKIDVYLVEMGGEIRARGAKTWVVAIEHPNFDGSQSFQATINLKNESIATSGSYRKYKIDTKTGKKYIHIINPKTGYATMSNLLSASVIAATDCADVDGYATAFIAMGLNKTKTFLKTHSKFKVFLIYSDSKGKIKTFKTKNLKIDKRY